MAPANSLGALWSSGEGGECGEETDRERGSEDRQDDKLGGNPGEIQQLQEDRVSVGLEVSGILYSGGLLPPHRSTLPMIPRLTALGE